jgi:hypothetical protein
MRCRHREQELAPTRRDCVLALMIVSFFMRTRLILARAGRSWDERKGRGAEIMAAAGSEARLMIFPHFIRASAQEAGG